MFLILPWENIYRSDWWCTVSLLNLWSSMYQGNGSRSVVHRNMASENSPGLLSRWLSSHYHGGVHDEKPVARHTVNLLTSTIKVDADQTDLRFCFRIISPTKVYTLQVCFQVKRSSFSSTYWIFLLGFMILWCSLPSSPNDQNFLNLIDVGRECTGSDGLDRKNNWSNCFFVEFPNTWKSNHG